MKRRMLFGAHSTNNPHFHRYIGIRLGQNKKCGSTRVKGQGSSDYKSRNRVCPNCCCASPVLRLLSVVNAFFGSITHLGCQAACLGALSLCINISLFSVCFCSVLNINIFSLEKFSSLSELSLRSHTKLTTALPHAQKL